MTAPPGDALLSLGIGETAIEPLHPTTTGRQAVRKGSALPRPTHMLSAAGC
jgi:hypothetical protein